MLHREAEAGVSECIGKQLRIHDNDHQLLLTPTPPLRM